MRRLSASAAGWRLLPLGVRVALRRRIAVVVAAVAFALPLVMLTSASVADAVSRPSAAQFDAARMGGAEAVILPAATHPVSLQQAVRQRQRMDQRIRAEVPGSLMSISAGQVTVVGQQPADLGLFAKPWVGAPNASLLLVSGRLPKDGEVALSPAAVAALGTQPGGEVHLWGRDWPVVGVMQRALGLRDENVFMTTESAAPLAPWDADTEWLLPSVPAGWQPPAGFLIESAADYTARTSYAAKLPWPLVAGSAVALAAIVLMVRMVDTDAETRRITQMRRLGAGHRQLWALGVGTALPAIAAGTALTGVVGVPTAWWLRRRVWNDGMRIPPDFDIPWTTLAIVWAVAAGVVLLGMVVPLRAARQRPIRVAGDDADTDVLTRLRHRVRATLRRSLGWGTRIAVITVSAMVTLAMALGTGATLWAALNPATGGLPGQVAVAPLKPMPEQFVADMAAAAGTDLYPVQELRLANNPKRNLWFNSGDLHFEIQVVTDARDFELATGRSWTAEEEAAWQAGRVLMLDQEGQALTSVTLRVQGQVHSFPVTPAPMDPQLRPRFRTAVGPTFVEQLRADGVDVMAFTTRYLSEGGVWPGADVTRRMVLTATTYGLQPSQVRSVPPVIDAIGDGARTLFALAAATTVAVVALGAAAAVLHSRRRDRLLHRLGASLATRASVIAQPALTAVTRVTIGVGAGIILAAIIFPAVDLKVAVPWQPGLIVITITTIVTGITTALIWAITTRKPL